MNITLISNMAPASENIRGTSALPYYLIQGIQSLKNNKEYSISIWSFNQNRLSEEKLKKVSKELNLDIHIMPLPKWFTFVFKYHLLFIRIFLKYPLHNYIKISRKYITEILSTNPDIIWVYGEEMSNVIKQFAGYKRIHTLPDCESLYYYRMMEQRFVFNKPLQYWKCALMYRKFRKMECHFEKSDNITYHLVGEEDAAALRNLNPKINAHFIPHPHYEIKNENRPVIFHQPKIKLLIAGKYNHYMRQSADEALEMICDNSNIKEKYEITFLGIGWEKWSRQLAKVGFTTHHISFAPNYIEELCKHDIQLTPICIGTGTKGKVLDALANGLMVIGTPYALENIKVEDGKSCIRYNTVEELNQYLEVIPSHIHYYELMAEKGREDVLKYHNKEVVASILFA